MDYIHTLKAQFLLPIIAFITITANAQQPNAITWLKTENLPFSTNDFAKYPQGGMCDNITDQLIKSMPSIKHRVITLPPSRVGKYLDEGNLACYSCMIHREHSTPRVNYSIPTTVYPPFVVISTPEKINKISQYHGNPVSLFTLLTDRGLIYGQNSARKFGTSMDLITKNTQLYRSAALSNNGSNAAYSILAQLVHGYTDYTIDYPFLADHFNRNYTDQKVSTIPIKENKGKILLGAIGCSTSAPDNFAKNALLLINQHLKQTVLSSDKYQESQRKWLKNTFTDFDQYYQQQILQPIAQPSSVQQEADQPSGAGR